MFIRDSKGVSQTVRGTVWVAPRSGRRRKSRGVAYVAATDTEESLLLRKAKTPFRCFFVFNLLDKDEKL